MNAKLIIGDVAAGVAAALVTSVLNVTPGGLLGAAWYGWPTAWLYNLITNPPTTTYNYVNLAIDIAFWFAVALILSLAASHATGRGRHRFAKD